MKKTLLAVALLSFLFVSSTTASESVWEQLEAATKPLLSSNGKVICTAFGVSTDEFLTAAHCVMPEKGYLVDGVGTELVIKDTKRDLARLHAKVPTGILRLAKKAPKRGDEVMTIGYGLGLGVPMAAAGIISVPVVDVDDFGGPTTVIYGNTTLGFSGSPVVNKDGELVGVTRGGGQVGGIGQIFGAQSTWKDLKKFLTGK